MRSITSAQITSRLANENPWWDSPHAVPPPFSDWTPRAYIDLVFPLIRQREVNRAVVMMGPRRVGKTVLLHHAIQKLLDEGTPGNRLFYVSVDHPLYTGLGLETLLDLYQEATGMEWRRGDIWVFFDEIQYLKDWERHLKAIVDRYPNVKCTVSGSAAAALNLKSNESGAGRFTEVLIPPLTFYEYLLYVAPELGSPEDNIPFEPVREMDVLNRHLVDYLNLGGYPEAIFSSEIKKDTGRFIRSDIVDKVLLRDLPSLYGIQDIGELNNLFNYLAYNTAHEIGLEELSKNAGISKNTIKKYMEYLGAAFLVHIVHRVDLNATKFRRANSFKVFLANPSMYTAMFSTVHSDSEAMGQLIETAVFANWITASGNDVHFARWKAGEVDFIIKGQVFSTGHHLPMEIKWSDRFYDDPRELNSLLTYCATNNISMASVLTKTISGTETIGDLTIRFIPSGIFIRDIGKMGIYSKTLLPSTFSNKSGQR